MVGQTGFFNLSKSTGLGEGNSELKPVKKLTFVGYLMSNPLYTYMDMDDK